MAEFSADWLNSALTRNIMLYLYFLRQDCGHEMDKDEDNVLISIVDVLKQQNTSEKPSDLVQALFLDS